MYGTRMNQFLNLRRMMPRTLASFRTLWISANRLPSAPSCQLHHQLTKCTQRTILENTTCCTSSIRCHRHSADVVKFPEQKKSPALMTDVEQVGVSNQKNCAESKNTHVHRFESNSFAVPLSRAYPTPTAGKINKIQNGEAVSVKPKELYRDLKVMTSEDVLETFAASYQAMDKVHYALCLKKLFNIQSLFPGDRKREFIKETYDDERFQVLCAFVTRKGPFYQASIAFDMFQFLHRFGFRDDHPAITVYLQLLKHHLNDLHLDQLLQLVHITESMKRTKNAALIFEAVGAVIPHRTHELQALSLHQKLVALDLFHDRLKEKWRRFIWDGIVHDLEEFTPRKDHARFLLRVLGKINLTDANMENLCIRVIEKNLEAYSVRDLKDIVSSLVELSVYCPDLLNEIGHLVSRNSSDWLLNKELVTIVTLSDKLEVLSAFSEQAHVHDSLLDGVLQHLVNDEYSCGNTVKGLGLLSALRPKHLDEPIASKFSAYLENNCQMSNLSEDFGNLVTVQISLLTLGIQTPTWFWKQFAADSLTQVVEGHVNMQGNRTFTPLGHGGYNVTLAEVVGVLKCLDSNCSLPQLLPSSEDKRSPLEQSPVPGFHMALTRAFQHLRIQNNCVLDSGLSLDYVIQDIHEQLETSNITGLAIKLLPASAFTRNHHTLKGFPCLYVTALQNLGYTVVVVNPMTWKKIPERERTLYLRHRIQQLLQGSKQEINII